MNCVICGREIERSVYANAVLCGSDCFEEHYWQEAIKEAGSSRSVRIEGEHYFLGEGNGGFDGREFKVVFFDGQEIATRDLRYNGRIPLRFAAELPDNARWA